MQPEEIVYPFLKNEQIETLKQRAEEIMNCVHCWKIGRCSKHTFGEVEWATYALRLIAMVKANAT